ncbi:nuclear transport factor 2 family protein [Oceanicola sp. S124]|uniref:nuclear transport factor 2 family protein n=1 Tax=Oceanicola sp. S124 TaxID=1042378 RepID=UPI0002559CDE|nr:nuclear transport factor 2 family protein [Oceanicola sp. S124]
MIRPRDPATLADTEALGRLVAAYSRAVDRRDMAALAALYLPEGTDTHGKDFSGGVADYIAYVTRALSAYEATAHYVMQTRFEIDGDTAEGEVHKLNYHRTHGPDAQHVITGSRSLDHYARRNGAWFFRARHVVTDWVDRRPAAASDWDDPAAGAERGQPGPGDASYRLLTRIAADRGHDQI